MIVRIRENSWLAKLSAKKLKTQQVVVVFGTTIHLCNTSRDTFLRNEKWVCHELAHVQQYQRYGKLLFLLRYLWESLLHGYRMNRYELEAKGQERKPEIMLQYVIA